MAGLNTEKGGLAGNLGLVFPQAGLVEYSNRDSLSIDKPGQVLIRSEYSLISPGTELAMLTGTHVGIVDPNNKFAKYPFYPGYALVGRIADMGPEVVGLQPGDQVFALAPHAQFVLRDASSELLPVIRLPDGLDPREALFSRLAAISMTSLMRSCPYVGSRVVVLGMGLIGNLAAQHYTRHDCKVLGVDIVEARLTMARRCGLESVLNATAIADLPSAIREACGVNPELIVEATGEPGLVKVALEAVAPGGEVVLLGSPRAEVTLDIYEWIHRKGVTLSGAHEGMQGERGMPSRKVVTRQMLDLLARGDLSVSPLITHEFAPTRAAEAYRLLLEQKDEALGVVFRW